MRYFLDTHVFLWKIGDSGKIPRKVYDATENPLVSNDSEFKRFAGDGLKLLWK